MKPSRFNYFLKYDDNHILYNTLSDRLLLLDPFLVDLLQGAINSNEIDELKTYHPSFYQQLIDDKFIIDENIDETEKVRKIMQAIDGDETHYHLIINPTMNCNFKCWYCYESHIKESKMSEETIEHIVDHLNKTLTSNQNIKSVTIGWFGGEPLLQFKQVMLPIMEKTDELRKRHLVSFQQNITTNGFLLRAEMIPYFKQYNLNHFQITLDGNRSFHDTVRYVSKNRGSYDDIMANIKLLVKNELSVTVRVNFTEKNLEGMEGIYEDLKGLSADDMTYFGFSFHKVWQETASGLNDRVVEIADFFRSKGIYANLSYIPDSLINSCYADKKNQATINYDGNVFKCTARDFNKNNREGVLKENGEIEWNEKYYNRMEIKLKNKPCQNCGILPLCNGGCSQVAIEANGKDFCVFDFDEEKKRDIVYRKVAEALTYKM
ncbi:MAG: arylsulfatase regulator [Mucilaginibacter sp.]|nr:arylsulfatase regulator [Mucilaginibacter sp.]